MPYPSKEALERAKLTVDLLAPVVLVVVVLVAFLNAQSIGKMVGATMKSARIEFKEAEFFGVKFAAQQADEKRDLNKSLDEMVQRQTETLGLLKCQRDGACKPDQTARITALLGKPAVPPAIVQTLERSKQTVAANEKAISQAEAALPKTDNGDWVVIVGADIRKPDADDEVRRLAKLYPANSVGIVLRGSWYRTLVRFPSSDEAQRNVPKIKSATGRAPYVRRLSDWCATLTLNPQNMQVCEPPGGV